MSLFSGLYVGASGLVTNQNALNTTAHNLSNIGTTGYTRQQTIQANKNYDTIGQAYVSPKQVGSGVAYADVRAVRDYFLDKAYRQEQGRAEFYTTNYNAITEMETLFGELQGVAFQDSLTEFTRAVEELKKQPEDGTNQGLVVSKAQTFLERAQAVYNGLSGYQDNMNIQIKDNIDKINEYGKKIWEINQKIVAIETGGIERANDLRDARDQLLDELAALGKIAYDEDYHGIVTVQFEGVDFVTQDYVNEMGYIKGDEYNKLFEDDIKQGLKSAVDPDFYVPTWPKYKHQEVFSVTEDISSDKNTDIGALKALYNARGNTRGTYRNLYPAGEIYPEYPYLNKAININGTEYIPEKDPGTGHYNNIETEGRKYDVSSAGIFRINGTDYYIDDTSGEVKEGSSSGSMVGTVGADGKVTIAGNKYAAKKNSAGHYTSVTAINTYTVSDDGVVKNASGKEIGKLGISQADSINTYEAKTTRSSVMTVMAEFDNLIRGIVTGMNKILSSDGSAEGASGDNLLFSRISDKSVPTGTDGWTTSNLMINAAVQKSPSTLNNGFMLEDGSRDQY